MTRVSHAPLLVLVLGLAATIVGLSVGLRARGEAHAASFDLLLARTSNEVEARLAQPRFGMAGARGVAAMAQDLPDVAEFRRYVQSRDLPREFPGVTGMGLIERVPRAGLPDFSRKLAMEHGAEVPIRTGGDADELFVIRAIEPLDANRAALGFDIGSEPARRLAAERAFREGRDSATAPVHLLQDRHNRFGALYLLPIFASGLPQRAGPDDAVVGLVFSAITYDALLAGLVRETPAPLYIELHDASPGGTTDVLHRSAATPPVLPQHVRTVRFDFAGRELELSVQSTPALEATQSSAVVWAAAALGAIASLLGAFGLWQIERTRRRALEIAEDMTQELDRLATVARLTNDGVLMTDAHGLLLWANPAFFAMSGYAPDEILGKRPGSLLHSEHTDAATLQSIDDAVARREPFHGELLHRSRDGRDYWVEVEVQAMRDRDGALAGVICILADITERRAQARELAESHAFLDRTGRIAGIGSWQVDLVTGQVTWSDQIRRLLEATDEYHSQLDNDIERFFAPRVQPQLRKAVDACIADGTPWDLELPMLTLRGRPVWVRSVGAADRENGVSVRLLGALQDITDRKHAELALEEQRNLLDTTLHSIGDAVLTADIEGRVRWLNPTAEALTGWRANDARGRPSREVLRLEIAGQPGAARCPIEDCLQKEYTVGLEPDTVLIARDGTRYEIEDSAAPLRADNGRMLGVVMVFRDVTEKRWLERKESLDRSRRELTELTDALAEGFLVLDRDWNVLGANPALAQMLGVEAEKVLTRSVWECLPQFSDPVHVSLLQSVRADGQRRNIELRVDDGRTVLAGAVHPHYAGIAINLWDVTQERLQRDKLERSSDLFRAVNRAALVAARKLGDADLLQVLVEELRGAVGAHLATIHLLPFAGEAVPPPAISLSDKYARWRDFSAPIKGLGLLAEAARGRGVMRLTQDELLRHPAFGSYGDVSADHPPLRGLLSVSLLERNGTLLGFLQVSDRFEEEFDDDDVATCVQFGQIVAIAIEWGRHLDQLQVAQDDQRVHMAELQGQKDLLAAAERLAGSASWLLRAEDGHVRLEWSGAVYRMLGVDPATTRPSLDALVERTHPDDRAALERALAGARDGGVDAVVEHRLRVADGADRWVRHGIRVLERDGRTRLLGILQGIGQPPPG